MDGLGDGYEAFVERLQMDIGSSQSGNLRGHPPHPSQSQFHQARYVGYPSTANPFTINKRDASPSLSDLSAGRASSSMSMEVSMQETLSPPCPSNSSGLARVQQQFSSDVNQMPDAPPRRGAHRRAQSEIAYRLPDELLLERDVSADIPELPDDISEDVFSDYLETDLTGGIGAGCGTVNVRHSRSLSIDGVLGEFTDGRTGVGGVRSSRGPSDAPRPRHFHSNSMDGSTSLKQELLACDLDSLETKKAMAADKLAELALVDPKRAKRILANRQSAARSKERKTRYISELEHKVQTLQTEATTLSAQLTMLQRDTSGISTENSELKLRLQNMEQQAQLCDALNDALKEEVQRLKLVTGQMGTANGHNSNLGSQNLPLKHAFLQHSQQSHQLTSQQLNSQQQQVQLRLPSEFIQPTSFGSLQGH